MEGSAAVLECRVTGEPEPDIYWYRDGAEIGETDPKYRYEFEGEHGVSLVVNNARMSDAGMYTCKAVNAAGSAESSAHLIGGGQFQTFHVLLSTFHPSYFYLLVIFSQI